jgi:O-antigen/teichoic acid export membrane protein
LYAGTAATAYFAGASQIGQLFVLAPMAAVSSLIPRMAEKAKSSAHELHHAMNRVLNLAILCAIPMYCSALLLGPAIVRFWKPQYAPVAQILPLIMLGRMAMLVCSPIAISMYASGRERALLAVSISCAIAALAIDYIVIPRYGFKGAACACAFNQSLCAIGTVGVSLKTLKYKLHLHGATIIILSVVAIAQVGFALTTWRTEAAVAGLFISIIVLFMEPMLLKQILPMLVHRDE